MEVDHLLRTLFTVAMRYAESKPEHGELVFEGKSPRKGRLLKITVKIERVESGNT